MGYICTKRLSLGGETYYPGDSIPDNAFVSGRVNKLKASGYVTEADDAEPAAVEANVTVGVVALDLDRTGNLCTITNEALQTAVFTMQMSAADAAAAILNETDERESGPQGRARSFEPFGKVQMQSSAVPA